MRNLNWVTLELQECLGRIYRERDEQPAQEGAKP